MADSFDGIDYGLRRDGLLHGNREIGPSDEYRVYAFDRGNFRDTVECLEVFYLHDNCRLVAILGEIVLHASSRVACRSRRPRVAPAAGAKMCCLYDRGSLVGRCHVRDEYSCCAAVECVAHVVR